MTMMLKTGVAHGLPRFSTLEFRHIGPDQWLITKPFMYYGVRGTVVVPSGFISDLDSLLRIPILYAALKGRSVRAVVIHDYLYKTQKGKPMADSTFLAAMKDEGLPARRRYPIYWGVVLFGHWAYTQYARKIT